MCPLEWWIINSNLYSFISTVAKSYLLIQGKTSVPSESVFSSASRIITDLINRLTKESADKLIFLNNNLEYIYIYIYIFYYYPFFIFIFDNLNFINLKFSIWI